MAQTSADTSASTKVAGLVDIGIQAFAHRDVAKLGTCLKDIFKTLRGLRCKQSMIGCDGLPRSLEDEQKVDIYEEYERMTQLRGTRLPELIRNCMNQEENPQIFLLSAEINLKLDFWSHNDDDDLCLNLIPEKLFRLMSNPQDLEVIKHAYTVARKTILNAKLGGGMDPVSNPLFRPEFVDILLRIGMQYPEHEEFTRKCFGMGIPAVLGDTFCTTFVLGRRRATVAIRKVLNAVADIIANESSTPALLVFSLMCFSSVSTADQRGELRIMINLWIQEALPRLIKCLDHPNDEVQAAAMEAFADVIRSSPQAAKQVVDGGIFVRIATTINREEFDIVGDNALRLLWICIRKKPEDWVIAGIVQAQIPAILTQRLLLRNNDVVLKDRLMNGLKDLHKGVAELCIQKICEFIPLTLAKNLMESGTVLDWLNYIKEDPYKLARFHFLRAILKYLAPTLRDGHADTPTPSFQTLTQMVSETVGLDVAKKIEAVETPEDLGIQSWDEDYRNADDLSTYYEYYDSDDDMMMMNRESDSDSD